jgi:L-ectoine synthase
MSMSQDFNEEEETAMCFSQCVPEQSQSQAPPSARQSEQANLQNMDASARSRLTTDLSRYILFKSLSNEPIDRTKLVKEAFPKNLQDTRVTNAVLEAANQRMNHIFGLDIRKAPDVVIQNKHMPSKFKERLFVVNRIKDNELGLHSKALHGFHIDSMVEKALLMLVLAFVYCKGEIKDLATGKTHAITPGTLYVLDKHDKHILYAHDELSLACVFNPPVTGREAHDADGAYPASS